MNRVISSASMVYSLLKTTGACIVCLSVSLSVNVSINRISMCMEYMDGGSLDTYGAIPEQVFGRITVSVSSFYKSKQLQMVISLHRLSMV